jgi:hypothetical protein
MFALELSTLKIKQFLLNIEVQVKNIILINGVYLEDM